MHDLPGNFTPFYEVFLSLKRTGLSLELARLVERRSISRLRCAFPEKREAAVDALRAEGMGAGNEIASAVGQIEGV